MSQGTQSIDRAAQVLVHVLETPDPPTVGALSARLELPKSTTSRLVGALERQGLIQRDGGGGHLVPGAVLQRYARRETGDAELVDLASEALDRLAQASGETVNVGVPSLGAVELLDQRDSRHFLGSTNWATSTDPVVVTWPSWTLYACVPNTSLVENSISRSSVPAVCIAASSTL